MTGGGRGNAGEIVFKTRVVAVMLVRINLLSYETPEYHVQAGTKISELKHMIEDDVGIPVANFVLKFGGRALDNEQTLGHYGIHEGSMLDIEGNLLSTLRPRFVGEGRMAALLSQLEALC